MDARSLAQEAFRHAREAMKQRGYRARGKVFWRRTESGNTWIIDVQRSRYSTRDEVRITVNYGVYSALVGRLHDDLPESVDVARAHFQERMGKGDDQWITIRKGDPVQAGAEALRRRCENAAVALAPFATDEALREEWLVPGTPGEPDRTRRWPRTDRLGAPELPGVSHAQRAHRPRTQEGGARRRPAQ